MKLLVATILLMIYSFSSFAAENIYIAGSLSRARALSMGSAYTSVTDDFSSGLYNPGTFMLNKTRNERPFRIFLNPVGMGTAFKDYSRYDRDYIRDDKLTFDEALISASLLLKGAVFENQFFNIGFNLGEQCIPEPSAASGQKHFFSIRDYSKRSFDTTFINFKISETVSLGLSGTIFRNRTDDKHTDYIKGYAFGVLIKPNPKLNVGVAYNDIPAKISKNNRFMMESIEGETVMTGISYYPDEKSVLSIDLRNLNKDDKLAAREIHTGIERRFGERIALRAGYFQQKETGDNFYSFGIGILPMWEKISKYVNSTRTDLISYSYILEKNDKNYNYHIFSMLFKY